MMLTRKQLIEAFLGRYGIAVGFALSLGVCLVLWLVLR